MKRPDDDYKGWEPDRKRWTRMYKGVRFRRTPEQLGLSHDNWTAERSCPAWLAWLRAAIKHFDLTGEVPSPPKKAKKKPPRKKRFVAWRDDPDYPKDLLGARRGLGPLREYIAMGDALCSEEAQILDQIHAESNTDDEFTEYLQLQDAICGEVQTLDDRRHAIVIAWQILDYAKTLSEIRRYAKTLKDVHEDMRIVIAVRPHIDSTDELHEQCEALHELLETAKWLWGTEPLPSYRGWEGPPRYRWSKMHKGVRLRVTCEQLGLPKECWNARDSHQAWLTWLQNEIQAVNHPT